MSRLRKRRSETLRLRPLRRQPQYLCTGNRNTHTFELYPGSRRRTAHPDVGQPEPEPELPISRDGTISFPDSGPVTVAGLSFDEARQQIRKRISEQYIGVEASVTLGELRSMRVFVLGEARNPGSYSVSSLSTITNALYVSGGIKQNGSLRNVQHKRNGKLVGTLDVYDLCKKATAAQTIACSRAMSSLSHPWASVPA